MGFHHYDDVSPGDLPYDRVTGKHPDTIDPDAFDLENLPDSFVAIIDYGYGEVTYLASRGAEVIRFDGQNMDPVWLDDLEEALQMKKTIQQAVAVATAGDNFASSRELALEELRDIEEQLDYEIDSLRAGEDLYDDER